MAVDDVYKLTVSATGQGSIYQNVVNLRMKQEGDPTNANFVAFITQLTNIFKTEVSTSVTWTDYEAKQQWGANMAIDAPKCRRTGGKEFFGPLTSIVGADPLNMLPPQAAAVITWTTGEAGRRKRGRLYAFGIGEDSQSEGTWSASKLTSWNTKLDTFLAEFNADTGTSPIWELVVWSERTASGCIPATPPAKGHVQVETPHPELAATGVKDGILRSTVYTQRRRTRGVGR